MYSIYKYYLKKYLFAIFLIVKDYKFLLGTQLVECYLMKTQLSVNKTFEISIWV